MKNFFGKYGWGKWKIDSILNDIKNFWKFPICLV
jgi:hypothetical protein